MSALLLAITIVTARPVIVAPRVFVAPRVTVPARAIPATPRTPAPPMPPIRPRVESTAGAGRGATGFYYPIFVHPASPILPEIAASTASSSRSAR